MNFITLIVLLLSFNVFASHQTESNTNQFVFEATMIENMQNYTEGSRRALGMGETDLWIFDKEDHQSLILSCQDGYLKYFTTNGIDINFDFSNLQACSKLRNDILSHSKAVSENNVMKFIFDSELRDFKRVVLPSK